MILPTKYLTPGQSLLGTSAQLLTLLERPLTVNQLWEDARRIKTISNFDRFVLALDLLFLMGAVDLFGGRLRIRT